MFKNKLATFSLSHHPLPRGDRWSERVGFKPSPVQLVYQFHHSHKTTALSQTGPFSRLKVEEKLETKHLNMIPNFKAVFVTGGLSSFSNGTSIFISSTEMLTPSGWTGSVPLPWPYYSHAQVSIGNKVSERDQLGGSAGPG